MSESQFVQIERRDKFSEKEFYPMISSMFEQIWINLLPPQLVNEDLPTKVSKNIVTPPDAPIPDCLPCGACCGAMICVAVSPNDVQTPAENYWDITTDGANGEIVVDRYLRRNGETLACASLEGAIGEQVKCDIYERRPKMCHVFEAGSDKCHAIRRAYGIEPFLSLEEMTEAMRKLNAKATETISEDIIGDAKIAEKDGTNLLEISVLLRNGELKPLHTYDPNRETWRQYQFSGLTFPQARELVNSRTQTNLSD